MSPSLIDLTNDSDDDDDSPRKAAIKALQSFYPRKEKEAEAPACKRPRLDSAGPYGSDSDTLKPPTWQPASVVAATNKPQSCKTETILGPSPVLHAPNLKLAATNAPTRFTAEEDTLLRKLKEVDQKRWSEIVKHFPHRSSGSIQVHYSTKLKCSVQRQFKSSVAPKVDHGPPRGLLNKKTSNEILPSERASKEPPLVKKRCHERNPYGKRSRESSGNTDQPDLASRDPPRRLERRKRQVGSTIAEGFVSWQDLLKRKPSRDDVASETPDTPASVSVEIGPRPFKYPDTLTSLITKRELGLSGFRSAHGPRKHPEELKNLVLSLGPSKCYEGTSGDVNSVAWAPDGLRFAAGSIAIIDEHENKPCNLLFGSTENDKVYELPQHHVRRSLIKSAIGSDNGWLSNQQPQVARLFMTVSSVGFTPDGTKLISTGGDKYTRIYDAAAVDRQPKCLESFEASASVDLLSIRSNGSFATAHHSFSDNITVYSYSESQGRHTEMATFGPDYLTGSLKTPIFPTSLKFGLHSRHFHLLLAGFASDGINDDALKRGQACLWDLNKIEKIDIGPSCKAVDVAWNPAPSAASTSFIVAGTPVQKKNRNARSVVQCFAPNQGRARKVVELDCPALDINDAIYCQHDANLIAAGATDGKVYVWDQRQSSESQGPLHVFAHGEPLSVHDHDMKLEEVDTGVRFLAWSATASRLYSASSDGVVKVWNPYRAKADALVENAATYSSAIMSGAFSSDYRELLIGEEQRKINLLSTGNKGRAARSALRFKLESAAVPKTEELSSVRSLLESGEIEFRPAGTLPIRQAVQGPNYKGPYYRKPTDEDIAKAQTALQDALQNQNEAHSTAAMLCSRDSATRNALNEADNCVRQAQNNIQQLAQRREDVDSCEGVASHQQSQFRRYRSERRRLKREFLKQNAVTIEPCKLDCICLRDEQESEVIDNSRSKDRIPGDLRDSRNGIARRGLTGAYIKCSDATLPTKDDAKAPLYDRSNFACFRCSGPARVSPKTSCITCTACGLAWDADVLGFTLIGNPARHRPKKDCCLETALEKSDETDFGVDDIEYYHSQFAG